MENKLDAQRRKYALCERLRGTIRQSLRAQFGADLLAKCIKVRDARVPAHRIEAATCRLSPLAGLFDGIKGFGWVASTHHQSSHPESRYQDRGLVNALV